MDRILSWYRIQVDTIKAIIIFSATVFFVFIVFLTVTIQMDGTAKELMKPYFTSDAMLEKHLSVMKKPVQLPEEYFSIIKMERNIMNTRKQHHYDLAVTFFKNYYGVLVISMILSCIGGLILFILINKGWKNAGITLQSLFLAIVICLTFFGFFPLVFEQEKNLNANMSSYINYSKAEMGILRQISFLNNPAFAYADVKDTSTGKSSYQYDSVRYYRGADSIISSNVDMINESMSYVLNINSKEIKSVGDVFKILSSYQSGKLDSTSVP